MDLGLKGKVAIVTGGAKGIGSGCCEVLAEEGCNLVINYRSDPEACEAFVQRMADEHGIKAVGVQGDISKKEDRAKIMQTAMDAFGTVDLLVNNAAFITTGLLETVTEENWNKAVETNLTAPVDLIRRFIEIVRSQGKGGRIVNVSAKAVYSISSVGKSVYTCTKAALTSFTRAMAKEAAPYGVIINAVVPGYVNTNHNNFEADTESNRGARKRLPTGKFAFPRDIGDSVAYLLSERASQQIGVVFDCTGGLNI